MLLSQKSSFITNRASFTLVELLIVIGIVAVLSVVVIVVLNPAQLLAQARDSNRLNDLASLNTAISLFQTDNTGASLGTTNTVYVSLADSSSTCGSLGLPVLPSGWTYNCVNTTTLKKTDGTGWIPLSFNSISANSPLSLPTDPTNASSSGLYYTYVAGTTTYELTAQMESTAKHDAAVNDGDSFPGIYSKGSQIGLTPGIRDLGLVGYWKFDEGSGTTGYDSSGKGNTATLAAGTPYASGSSCKLGSCVDLRGTTYYATVNDNSSLRLNTETIAGWFKYDGTIGGWGDVIYKDGFNLQLRTDVSASQYLTYNSSNVRVCDLSSGQPVWADQQWHFVAASFDGSTKRIYADGTLAASGAFTIQ
jgi:type II secretory pathway pseudopilin PulG